MRAPGPALQIFVVVMYVLATSAGARQPDCQPSWLSSTFGVESSNDSILAMTRFDDGSGATLFAGGTFTTIGGTTANRIAKWNGYDNGWSPLGTGLSGPVYSVAVFDDGSGPALYAGGNFAIAGGISAPGIARWDGHNWSAVGSSTSGAVYAMAVFDDGSGPALYAGGYVLMPGITGIARWDGQSWSSVGGGMNNRVQALAVHDDGFGPALYAGGLFTIAGGHPANRIARWQGGSWMPLGDGLNDPVSALTSFDDGAGPALMVGGEFTTAGGQPASRIARWRSGSLTPLSQAWFSTPIQSLAVFDDGTGTALYAGGSFSIMPQQWQGPPLVA